MEEVYACIANQLNITYVFSDPTPPPTSEIQSAITLPQDLYTQLHSAVENHSITDLRRAIEQVEQIDTLQAFATQLRNAAQQFDLDKIKHILQETDNHQLK